MSDSKETGRASCSFHITSIVCFKILRTLGKQSVPVPAQCSPLVPLAAKMKVLMDSTIIWRSTAAEPSYQKGSKYVWKRRPGICAYTCVHMYDNWTYAHIHANIRTYIPVGDRDKNLHRNPYGYFFHNYCFLQRCIHSGEICVCTPESYTHATNDYVCMYVSMYVGVSMCQFPCENLSLEHLEGHRHPSLIPG